MSIDLKNDFWRELIRNTTGYFLVIAGVIVIILGARLKVDKLLETGGGLVTASLLAFQAKRTPDGNTSTVQVTTPEPTIPPTPSLAESTQSPK